MARKKFYSLKKPKIRASWNRYSLYNLWHQPFPKYFSKTFFQQKWAAKSAARGYHGEHVRENQWNRQFSRHIPSVVPLEASVLAASDGSDLAAGRGSGLVAIPPKRNPRESIAKREEQREKDERTVPYMSGVFWPLERRLDVAVWRALFASSARQARQFVVHGFVKVNGKKIRYPGYLLNPGDMFSVDPEMVHIATGQRPADKHAPKEEVASEETSEDGNIVNTAELRAARLEARKQRNHDQVQRKVAVAGLRDQIVEMLSLEDPAAPQARELHEVYLETYSQQYNKGLHEQVESVLAKVRRNIEEMSLEDDLDEEIPSVSADEVIASRKQSLKDLRRQINEIIAKKGPSGTRKRELRALYQEVSKTLSKAKNLETDDSINAFRGRLAVIEGAVDASSDGLVTLPDGSVVSIDGQLQFGADGEITSTDALPASPAPGTVEADNALTLPILQSAIRAALASPSSSSTQSRALLSLQRSADFDTTAELEILSARFTAIVGPDRASLSIEEAQSIAKETTNGGNSRGGTAFGVKKAISEHLEKLGKMAEYQGASTKSISLLPEFAKAWKDAMLPPSPPSSAAASSGTSSAAATIPSPSPFPAKSPNEPSPDNDAEDTNSTSSSSKDGPAYLTPWRPRPYMSAFAFIPKYLEVNQNVCSAVYLRNPVVRPGSAEVPSPCMPETSQLVFGWYLRRR